MKFPGHPQTQESASASTMHRGSSFGQDIDLEDDNAKINCGGTENDNRFFEDSPESGDGKRFVLIIYIRTCYLHSPLLYNQGQPGDLCQNMSQFGTAIDVL